MTVTDGVEGAIDARGAVVTCAVGWGSAAGTGAGCRRGAKRVSAKSSAAPRTKEIPAPTKIAVRPDRGFCARSAAPHDVRVDALGESGERFGEAFAFVVG